MGSPIVIASDLGSSSCKTVAVDPSGNVLASSLVEYPTFYPQPGWAEQNPDDWYKGFCVTVRDVLDKVKASPEDVIGVGIVGVTHTVVFMGDDDRPLLPSILIFDNRSQPQVDKILQQWGDEVRERTLNVLTPVWSWPQLLWVRENRPDIWGRVQYIFFQKDYVRHRLAPSVATDVIDASGSSLFDPIKEEWIESFYRDLGLSLSQLPRVHKPSEIIARVSKRGSEDTGLLEGTPVIAGTTDTAAEVFGAGCIRPGSTVIKLASVGRIAVVTERPASDFHLLNYRHVIDGLWYPGTASKYAASAYKWRKGILWSELEGSEVYHLMDKAAARIRPGAGGLIFHPHLMGEWAPYWDESMRGDFIGLTARHSREHLTRAVLEGVAFALRDALEEMEGLGLEAKDIRLIGQGAKSDIWSEIVSDVLDRILKVPEQIDAAYGAALITAIGMGLIEPDPERLDSIVKINRVITPNEHNVSHYSDLFEVYRYTDKALRPAFGLLHRFDLRDEKE